MAKKRLPPAAQLLRSIRAATGYSQTEMAFRLKVRERTYQRLEAGSTRLTAEMLWRARAVALESPGASTVASLDTAMASGALR
jgi:transcriptional regulator with XRE-family HTH domain